jgi:SAM-dependent methyltransferase
VSAEPSSLAAESDPAGPTAGRRASGQMRPARALVGALLRAAPRLAPAVEKLMWRCFYELASLGRRELGTTMMNYGYAPLDSTGVEPAGTGSREDRFGLQLYAAVAGAAELAGKDVLEVGCGRGGGAVFVFERFGPRALTGLDLARQAIERCRSRFARPGLEFVAGDAEHLPFPDGAFDAVLSVESSHCYPDPSNFLREAHRVLRPGGRLLLADIRHTTMTAGAQGALFSQDDVVRLRGQLADAGFATLEEEDITANVVRALELDTPIRRARIERRVPKPLRRHALAFAAVEGGPVYKAFAEHELTYLRFVLEKPPAGMDAA